jgi:hypothetical protein
MMARASVRLPQGARGSCLVEQAYERGAHDRRIDYRPPPVPRLGEEDAAWARAILVRRAR